MPPTGVTGLPYSTPSNKNWTIPVGSSFPPEVTFTVKLTSESPKTVLREVSGLIWVTPYYSLVNQETVGMPLISIVTCAGPGASRSRGGNCSRSGRSPLGPVRGSARRRIGGAGKGCNWQPVHKSLGYQELW